MKGGFKRRYQLATISSQKARHIDSAHLKHAGFTIIEVLIVLAVTGGLFLSAALLIGGRQNATEFQQAINNVKTQIQQTINDVNAGFYPSSANFTCQATGGGGISFAAGAKEQGTNQDCMFLGKVLQFKVQGGTGQERFFTYSVAGLRQNADSTEVTTYAQASPTVIVPNGNPAAVPTASNTLQYGLKVDSMKFTSNGTTKNIGAVGFLNTLATYNNNGMAQGSQNVIMSPIEGSSLNATPTQTVAAANAASGLKATPSTQPSDLKTEICFQSGGTNQSGLITIGSNGRQLSVTLSIKANKTCQ